MKALILFLIIMNLSNIFANDLEGPVSKLSSNESFISFFYELRELSDLISGGNNVFELKILDKTQSYKVSDFKKKCNKLTKRNLEKIIFKLKRENLDSLVESYGWSKNTICSKSITAEYFNADNISLFDYFKFLCQRSHLNDLINQIQLISLKGLYSCNWRYCNDEECFENTLFTDRMNSEIIFFGNSEY